MTVITDIKERFGEEAAEVISQIIGEVKIGDKRISPASLDSSRGALMGFAIGESLGMPFEDQDREWISTQHGTVLEHKSLNPTTGSDSLLTLITADSVLADTVMHPERFASRLSTAQIDTRGRAVPHVQNNLRQGVPWWNASLKDSAGVAAAARCLVFGLVWSKDPERAAYEAALSSTATHGHPSAICSAAVFASAVALATEPNRALDEVWLREVFQICKDYYDVEVNGTRVLSRLELLPALVGENPESALNLIGSSALAFEALCASLWCATLPTPREAITQAVQAGGDTDTIAAMAGGLIGANRGENGWESDLLAIYGMQEILDSADRISALDSQGVEAVSRSSTNNEATSKDVPVHVSFLVDRSGSMAPLVDDVIGGFNSFLESQKNEPGECNMTLVQFDGADPFEILEKDKPIDEIPNLEHGRYLPRGNTPLLDALGDLITYCDERSSKEVIKSDQVVAVFTDGHENASHRWGRQALFNVIEKRKKEGWIFIFMGANQDSYLEAGRLGFDNENIQNYRGDSSGTRMAYSSMGDKLGEYRRGDYNMKQSRKRDFFEGDKRAEFDHQTRK